MLDDKSTKVVIYSLRDYGITYDNNVNKSALKFLFHNLQVWEILVILKQKVTVHISIKFIKFNKDGRKCFI